MIAIERRVAALTGRAPAGPRPRPAARRMALAQPPVSWPVVLFAGAAGAALAARRRDAGRAAPSPSAGRPGRGISPRRCSGSSIRSWSSPRSSAGWRPSRSSAWRAGSRCSGRRPSRWRGRGGRPGLARVLLLAALWTLVGLCPRAGADRVPLGRSSAYAWVETPVIQAVALFGPHLLGLPDAGRGAAAGARVLAGARRRRRRWSRRAGASAPGGWRSRCRCGRSRWWCGWCSRTRAQELKWQPGMEQEFYDRHLALTAAPADPPPDVTIWSETAVPFVLGQAPELLARVRRGRGAEGTADPRHPPRRAGAGRRALVQLAGGARPGRDGGGGLRQAPPGAVRRVHPARRRWSRGSACRRSTTLTRGGFTAGSGPHLVDGARPAAVPAADLLRGDLSRRRSARRRGGPSGWCR